MRCTLLLLTLSLAGACAEAPTTCAADEVRTDQCGIVCVELTGECVDVDDRCACIAASCAEGADACTAEQSDLALRAADADLGRCEGAGTDTLVTFATVDGCG